MTELTQERINLFEALHTAFLIKKGFGAFAFISITDAVKLFEQYKESNQSADLVIRRYVRSF